MHKDWFGVCTSTLYARFQGWQQSGLFDQIVQRMVRFYAKRRQIKWRWQALNSKSCPAPLGGPQTGKNPTDRGKRGSKIHLLVDQAGAPLAVFITGANRHDQWTADDLIISLVVRRSNPAQVEQHRAWTGAMTMRMCASLSSRNATIAHIKHRRRRGEPPLETCPVPGETQFLARRWVVERTLGWLAKRRSLRVRWCRKAENWLVLVQFACAHILMDLAIYG